MGQLTSAGPPKRRRNAEVRSREYLTDAEVNRLISAAGENRNGHRDATMVLVAYRHGLRAGELVTLRWDAIDFAHGRLHVSRLKGSAEVGSSVVRPRAAGATPAQARAGPGVAVYLHVRARRAVHDRRAFARWSPGSAWRPASVSRCIRTCCATPAASSSPMTASIPARCRPISATSNIQHTVRYTELAPTRFKNFWRD